MSEAKRIRLRFTTAMVMGGVALAAIITMARPAVTAWAAGPMLSFTATTTNVGGAPDNIRIDLFRWSTDEERDRLVAAWNMTGGAGRGGRGGGGRGGGRGGAAAAGRGRAAAADAAPDPAAEATPTPRAGRGGGGAGEQVRPTPEGTLAKALQQSTTVGYLWSSEIAGYALHYAGKVTGPDGSDRILLITDRRLGATNELWKSSGPGAANNYEFSVIELRVNAKGEGEGKVALVGKVAPDATAKVVAPENYAALPVVLKNLKNRPVEGK